MNAETEIRPVLTLLRGGRIEGELPLVTRGPIDHLAEEDLETIRASVQLHEAGKEDEAKAMIAALEKKLGITASDKAAAFGPQEPWEGDLLAALGLQPDVEPPVGLPRDFRRFNEAETKRIDQINAERMRAKMRGNRGNVALAEGKLADIAARRHQRVELKERSDVIRETVQLAKDRGEEVDEAPPQGAAIIWSRDGFAEIKKHFTGAQVRVGERYRRGFEARGGDLQASQIRDSGGRGHDNNQFVADRFERAADSAFATRCDREVRLRCITHLSAAQMLQWVVGHGRSLRAFGAGGRAYARNKAALGAALDLAILVEAEIAEEAKKKADELKARGLTDNEA